MVQMPLDSEQKIEPTALLNRILPSKDVDAIGSTNIGRYICIVIVYHCTYCTYFWYFAGTHTSIYKASKVFKVESSSHRRRF